MSKWLKIYKDQIKKEGSLNNFVTRKIDYKKKLIDMVCKYSGRNGRILEAGCGSGITCVHLGLLNYNVVGIDSDEGMLGFARDFALKIKSPVDFKIGDIKNLDSNERYDVVFSNGVLEHFSDEDIIKIINDELEITIFIAPSKVPEWILWSATE